VQRPVFRGLGPALSRRDFARFITEYDRRGRRDFAAVFPELSGFMKACRSFRNTLLGSKFFR